MTGANVDLVAAALGIALPEFYRRFLRNHGPELEAIAGRWFDAASIGEEPLGEKLARTPPLALPITDPDHLVYLNRQVRGEPIGRNGVRWPDEYFVIGTHYCGDYWCIKLDGSDSFVWTCWADTCSFERDYDSLDQLMAEIRSRANDVRV